MGRITLVVFLFCGCASVETRPLETALEYQRDAKAFAIPAIVLYSGGLLTGVAAIEHPDASLRGISIAALGAGVVSTVVAAIYGYLADSARERAKASQHAGVEAPKRAE
jgi:hypothetical protein